VQQQYCNNGSSLCGRIRTAHEQQLSKVSNEASAMTRSMSYANVSGRESVLRNDIQSAGFDFEICILLRQITKYRVDVANNMHGFALIVDNFERDLSRSPFIVLDDEGQQRQQGI
jgi:hypothetical protein